MTVRLGQSATPSGMRIYAIGDVHGHLHLLESISLKIKTHIKNNEIPQYRIIFLGDYIDRGPDSAGCVQFLMDLISEDENVICLKGNHEDKLENFLANPQQFGDSFFGYGGVECATSYGVDMNHFTHTQKEVNSICEELKRNISPKHKSFYSRLIKSVTFGDYLFAHAGIRPGVPLGIQSDNDLMCIRSEFIYHKGLYDKVIVHGHTPAYPMEILPNRINVDTCAYETSVLSCLILEGTEYQVIEAKQA